MKILRKPQLLNKVPLSYPTIWRRIQAGTFPKPVQLGPNSVGWIEEEIDAWIADLQRGSLKISEQTAA
jgi:prophage regulatory protein